MTIEELEKKIEDLTSLCFFKDMEIRSLQIDKEDMREGGLRQAEYKAAMAECELSLFISFLERNIDNKNRLRAFVECKDLEGKCRVVTDYVKED